MSDCEEECPKCPDGIPAWVMTFADLMSLLMCFFVLLLSFSEMDLKKYRQLAGSMDKAFGVQRDIEASDIPKGTSIIAQNFSPGRPEPTPLIEVKQSTTKMEQKNLDINCPDGQQPKEEILAEDAEASDAEAQAEEQETAQMVMEAEQETQADATQIAEALEEQIENGQVEIETVGRKIVIRVKEHGSFGSGSATLRPSFVKVMDKMRESLMEVDGVFTVEGHTDDIPIQTARFRSNWELSASRAVSVAHELFKGDAIDPRRFTILGYAETRPLVPNQDKPSRAQNRRVEIVVEQDKEFLFEPPTPEDEASVIGSEDIEKIEEAVEGLEKRQFDYSLDEIF